MNIQDFKSLNGYSVKDEKARPVNNIAEMKAIPNLVAGNIIKTIGYYSANDGGGATYLIREKQETDIDDKGTIHFINDTLVAEMIIKDYVTPEMFGAYGDNVHDDTIAVQNAVSSNIKHIVLSKKYNISTPISVPSKKIIDGGGEIHSTTIGFKLDGARYITIKDIRIFAGINAVYIVSDTSYCSYINLETLYCDGNINNQISAGEKAIYINTTNYFINECYYKNCVMYNYQYGIYATAQSNEPQMQRHIFTECSPEGSTIAGIYVKNGERFTFENCRCLEGNSSKWVTEGICNAFNIISGEAWFSPYTNANFSENTNGLIIGALRNANVAINAPGRNGYIVKGKVIPYKENINSYFKDINSTGLSITYGDELITQFRKNTSQNVTLELTSDCYGGICKINEFYVKMFASGGELTVKVGDYFTKVLNSPATGYKYYRFTYNTLEAEKSWFVEELNLI